MFIRLMALMILLYLGYLGTQADALTLGGLENYREVLIGLVIAILATPLVAKLIR